MGFVCLISVSQGSASLYPGLYSGTPFGGSFRQLQGRAAGWPDLMGRIGRGFARIRGGKERGGVFRRDIEDKLIRVRLLTGMERGREK